MRFLLLQCFATAIAALAVRQSSDLTQSSVMADLNKIVSPASQVKIELRLRWSTYNAPTPAVVVNVTSEKDVASVVREHPTAQKKDSTYNAQVKYCTQNRIPFLTQNGGNGWAKTFNLGKTGVLINMAGLNAITFTNDKKQATIGGGAIIGDVIPAANAAGALVITGNCNCIGAVGALLGGGYGTRITMSEDIRR
jgi:FAD/FMN-containing dehydrogenase